MTVELYILPSFISSFCPVDFSIISCPSAPYILVLGSINDNVPTPVIESFTYNPVL